MPLTKNRPSAAEWRYMSETMLGGLEKILATGEITYKSFPDGVYRDTDKFFGTITMILDDEDSDRYNLAVAVIKMMPDHRNMTVPETATLLRKYGVFIGRMKVPRKLTVKGMETALSLHEFMGQLHRFSVEDLRDDYQPFDQEPGRGRE